MSETWQPRMRPDIDKAARIQRLLARATPAPKIRVDPVLLEYDVYLESLFRQAEDATRGYLLTRDAVSRGVDARQALYGRHSGARPWHLASEELRELLLAGELPFPVTLTQWRAGAADRRKEDEYQ